MGSQEQQINVFFYFSVTVFMTCLIWSIERSTCSETGALDPPISGWGRGWNVRRAFETSWKFLLWYWKMCHNLDGCKTWIDNWYPARIQIRVTVHVIRFNLKRCFELPEFLDDIRRTRLWGLGERVCPLINILRSNQSLNGPMKVVKSLDELTLGLICSYMSPIINSFL